MISGYFLSAKLTTVGKMFGKIVRLWVKVLFYSWLMLFITYIVKPSVINVPTLLRAIFPITLNGYWFMTSFFVLMVLVPMINSFIYDSKLTAIVFVFCIILFTSGVQSILPLGFLPFGGSLNLGIMISAYLYAAILRKFSIKLPPVVMVSLFIIGLLTEYVGMLALHYKATTNGIAPFCSAMAIFYATIHLSSFYNSIVNWCASSVLASYLVLCNPFSNTILWNVILHTEKYASHPVIPGFLICTSLIMITIFFDKIYDLLERKLLVKVYRKIDEFLLLYL